MPTIDFSKVKGLEPLPVGTYTATVAAATEGVSKKGNAKIDLQWKVNGGPSDGRIIFDTLTFTDAAMFRVKNTLKAMGFPADFKGNVEAGDMLDKTCILIVDIDASGQLDEEGEPYPPRNRVKKIKPVSAAPARRGLRK